MDSNLDVVVTVPVIYSDNLSTVALFHNPVLYSRTKHMELDLLSSSLFKKRLSTKV